MPKQKVGSSIVSRLASTSIQNPNQGTERFIGVFIDAVGVSSSE